MLPSYRILSVANFVTDEESTGNFSCRTGEPGDRSQQRRQKCQRPKPTVGTWPNRSREIPGISDFEDLNLEEESYWNGSDGSAKFTSGLARFHNDYNPDCYPGADGPIPMPPIQGAQDIMNQYCAITGGGFAGDTYCRETSGTSLLYGPSVIDFTWRRPMPWRASLSPTAPMQLFR